MVHAVRRCSTQWSINGSEQDLLKLATSLVIVNLFRAKKVNICESRGTEVSTTADQGQHCFQLYGIFEEVLPKCRVGAANTEIFVIFKCPESLWTFKQ